MKTKTIAAGVFKKNCLSVLDELQAKRESIIITRHGKPVAKLVPIDPGPDRFYNFMQGKGTIVGDIVSPVISAEEW